MVNSAAKAACDYNNDVTPSSPESCNDSLMCARVVDELDIGISSLVTVMNDVNNASTIHSEGANSVCISDCNVEEMIPTQQTQKIIVI